MSENIGSDNTDTSLQNQDSGLRQESDPKSEVIIPKPCRYPSCICQTFAPFRNGATECAECQHQEKDHGEARPPMQNAQPQQSTGTFAQSEQSLLEQPPENEIWFYNRGEEHFFLTNFIEGFPIKASLPDSFTSDEEGIQVRNLNRHPYYSQEMLWPTSEHLFQALKFKDTKPDVSLRICQCRSPRDALNMARRFKEYVDPKWQERNVQAMTWVIRQKFTQHQTLQQQLLKTGDKKLIEHTDMDKFWGDGGDGSGQNMLGKVLMSVRQQLREKEEKRRQLQANRPSSTPLQGNNGYQQHHHHHHHHHHQQQYQQQHQPQYRSPSLQLHATIQNYNPEGPAPPIPPKPSPGLPVVSELQISARLVIEDQNQ